MLTKHLVLGTKRGYRYLFIVLSLLSALYFLLFSMSGFASAAGVGGMRLGIGLIVYDGSNYVSSNYTTMGGFDSFNIGDTLPTKPSGHGTVGEDFNRVYLKSGGTKCSVGSSTYYDSIIAAINGGSHNPTKYTLIAITDANQCTYTQKDINVTTTGGNNALLISKDGKTISSFSGTVTFEKQPKKGPDGGDIYFESGKTPRSCTSIISIKSGSNPLLIPMSTAQNSRDTVGGDRDDTSYMETWEAIAMHLDSSLTKESLDSGCRINDSVIATNMSIDWGRGETDSGRRVLCNDKYGTKLVLNDSDCEFWTKGEDDLVYDTASGHCGDFYLYDTMSATKCQGYILHDPLPIMPPNFTPGDISSVCNGGSDCDAVSGDEGTSTCNVQGGFGWVICPVSNFLATMVDSMWGFVAGQLSIKPALFNDTSGTYTAWKVFRDYANIAFIIAFLFIVYSQVTSVGISNYGIKKMLPKLIIAAILVNVSYIVCQFAVDVFNLLGYSIKNLFDGIAASISSHTTLDTGVLSTTGQNGGFAGTIAGILVAGTLVVVALALGLLGPILLAVAMVFLILLLRQVFVVVLIAISPLAFVAYLLPNTEKWFKKWMDSFIKVLAVFPIIALVVGGSSVASQVILSAGITNTTDDSLSTKPSTGDDDSDTEQDPITQLVSVAVLTLPFFLIPGLLKKSLEASGSLGAKVKSWGDKATGRVGSKAKKRSGEMGAGVKRRTSHFKAGLANRGGKIGSIAGRSARREFKQKAMESDTTRLQQEAIAQHVIDNPEKYTERQRADARATAARSANEAVANEESTLSGLNGDALVAELDKGGHSEERQAAIIRRIAAVGGDGHVQKAFDHLMTNPATMGNVQQLSAEALARRKPAGISGTQMGQLQTGTLDSRERDSSGNLVLDSSGNPKIHGYADQLATKVAQQKMGPKDYAGMNPDDLARLAELSQAGKLTAADLAHIDAQFKAIKADQTLQGSMTGEKEKLFENIRNRQAPQNADGSARKLQSITPPSP